MRASCRSCIRLGYFADPFLHHFVRRGAKRAPLINRGAVCECWSEAGLTAGTSELDPRAGYFARFAAFDQLTRAFLQRCSQAGAACQILSVGAGFDSAFWRLQARGRCGLVVLRGLAAYEPDACLRRLALPQAASSRSTSRRRAFVHLPAAVPMPCRPAPATEHWQVTTRKAAIIAAKPQLQQQLGAPAALAGATHALPSHTLASRIQARSHRGAAGGSRVHTDRYCLLPGDLREAAAVLAALQQAGLDASAPTLVLAECVLVYMEPEHSRSLLAALGALLATAAIVTYEQARGAGLPHLPPGLGPPGRSPDSCAVQIRPGDAFGQQMLLNLEVRWRGGGPVLHWQALRRAGRRAGAPP